MPAWLGVVTRYIKRGRTRNQAQNQQFIGECLGCLLPTLSYRFFPFSYSLFLLVRLEEASQIQLRIWGALLI